MSKTEQEKFWQGTFGDDYISRNISPRLLSSNLAFFSNVLKKTRGVSSILELGANIGMNLRAIKSLLPLASLHSVEINKKAVEELSIWMTESGTQGQIYHAPISEWQPARLYDLVLLKTVLIHIDPNNLIDVYRKIHSACGKYILLCEYYSPSPVSIMYRGHEEKLYKRDFAGELLDQFPDLILRDYGFLYHLDPNFPQDDINWFLIEKAS